MSDTSLVFNLVARERVSQVIGQLKAKLATVGKGIGAAMAVPAGAGIVTALGGIAAGAVAAGAAVKAFQAAAQPQLQAVAEASQAADAAADAHEKATLKQAQAQKLAAQGGKAYKSALREAESAAKAARDADAALHQQLKGLPPATRDTAMAFAGLKKDYQAWSDSLAPTTMPLFTKGINILRGLLPTLTPFVKAAAGAIGGFLDEVAVGVKSAGFKAWAADMSAAAGPALTNFLTIVKNLAIGFAGLLRAFLPVSSGMTGGLVGLSAAFAQWGTSLHSTEGFAQFMEMARNGGGMLLNLATAVLKVAVSLAPLLGTTTLMANALARIIANTPTPVLQLLAYTLLAVRVGMLGYRAATTAVTIAQRVMASSTYLAIAGWARMLAFGIATYTRLAVAAVMSATRTAAAWAATAARMTAQFLVTVIRVAVTTAAQFALMAARAVIWAATMAAQWLIAMGPVGWVIAGVIALVALIVANWDKVKQYTLAAWNWVVAKLIWAKNLMVQAFLNFTLIGLIIKHWSTIKAKTVAAWNAVVAWVRGIPGKLYQAFLNWTLLGLVIKHWSAIKTATVRKATEMVAWVRGLPGRISRAMGSMGSLLVSKGRAVVQGLWSGISSMGSWIYNKLIGWAKSMIPGPIAKALGIASPSKVTTAQGRWIARGLIDGLTGSTKQIRAAARLADIVRDALNPGRRRTRALSTINTGTKQLLRLAAREATVATRLKNANKKLSDLVKARDKLAADVKKGMLDAANITQIGAGEGPVTAESILTGLQDKLAMAQRFAADLATLRKKGIRSDLIAQIAQAGVEQGSAAAAALASADKMTVKQINSTQAQLVSAANRAGDVAGEAMYGTGIRAAQGIVKGLQREQHAIEKQMLKIAKSMQSAIKRALGIRSPSSIMADQVGRWIPPGVVRGIEKTMPQLDRVMSRLVRPELAATPREPLTAPTTMAPLMGAQAGGGTVLVRFEFAGADSEFKKLLRKTVRVDGRGSVQVLLG
ncbi:hypothetical protein ACFOOM_07555 [Streptomyces echinoruber]|uniref:Tape measure protein n=1 Tax=Streptomyces echinoruber TaxID=68898 RepID=A0A918QZP6_9ACTN|nr:hypothetical protein [Streptomyces echinoruber]GGZ80238.1 hypothetical protein GCM10010389_17490 [Streptomyces echinoruber]